VNTRVTLIQDVLDKRQDKAAGAEFYFSYFKPFDDEGKAVFSVEMLDLQVFIQTFDKSEGALALAARLWGGDAGEMPGFGVKDVGGTGERVAIGGGCKSKSEKLTRKTFVS
jgi:hypothetical protein